MVEDRLRSSPPEMTQGALLSLPTGTVGSDWERQEDAGSSGEHSAIPGGL